MKKTKILYTLLFFVGIVLSILGTYKTIFYGCDIDESYAISLSYRIVMGDNLFKEMWEVHQTSAIFMAPFIWIYRVVVGNTIGMVAYLRAVGCLCQFVIAIVLFHCLSKYTDKRMSCLFALIFYNFSPKYLSVFEFCFLQYIFLTLILIGLLYYFHYSKGAFLIIVGISLAGTVLAYPQTMLLVPVEYIILGILLKDKDNPRNTWKRLGWIFLWEAVCGILFVGYVLSGVSIKELIANIPMVLADASHSMSMSAHFYDLLVEFVNTSMPLVVIILIYRIFSALYHKVKGKSLKCGKYLCLLGINIFWVIPMFIDNGYPGLRHLDLFYAIYGMWIGLAYFNICTKKRHALVGKLRLVQLLFLALFAGCCMSSNLTIYANGGLLFPVMVLAWLEFILNESIEEDSPEEKSGEKADGRFKRILRTSLPFSLLLLVCAYFLLARCTLVRFTAVQPRTVFEELHRIAVGTAKDIYVTKAEHIQYHSKMETLQKYVGVDDTLFYLGSDTYLYFLIGNQIGVPTTISTPTFDQSTTEYYKRYPYKMPTIIMVDKYYVNLQEDLNQSEFRQWLFDNYDVDNLIDEDFAQIIYRKKN